MCAPVLCSLESTTHTFLLNKFEFTAGKLPALHSLQWHGTTPKPVDFARDYMQKMGVAMSICGCGPCLFFQSATHPIHVETQFLGGTVPFCLGT